MLRPIDISFPVYPLRPFENIKYGSKGAIFIQDKVGDIYLIDDTSKSGSFGQRRLKIKFELESSKTIKLYKLNVSFIDWSEFLSALKKARSKTYIDSNGRIFMYSPSKFVPLKYFKIKKIQLVEGSYCFLVLEGLLQKIKVCRPPPEVAQWAGILMSPTGFLLYGYSQQKIPDTIRKI